MNILITTHQLANFAGSELYTFELAKGLSRAGNKVTVYSRYVDAFEPLFALEGIELVMNLAEVKNKHFDVAHVQHNINALEVRQAFPNLPIFFLSHSASTFLENAPLIDINISLYGAVSKLVRNSLKQQGILKKNVTLVNNLIDGQIFNPSTPLREKPQQALIISNRIDPKTEMRIQKACLKLGMTLQKVGSRFQSVPNKELPQIINQADIVFTLGRGAMESMMCGRVPFILDYKGGDGLITPENYLDLEECHFNGTRTKTRYTVAQIVKEIRTKYSVSNGEKIHQLTMKHYATDIGVLYLMKLYQKTISLYTPQAVNHKLLNYIVETVHVTRLHTFSRSEVRNLQPTYDTKIQIRNTLRQLKKKVRSKNQDFISIIRKPMSIRLTR